MELLAPAGSPEALTAAVQAGADAVYLGFGPLNARRNAKNFTREELEAGVAYCHLRGVKVYLTLNTLLTNRELPWPRRPEPGPRTWGLTRFWCRTWGWPAYSGGPVQTCPSTPPPR